jgi:phosphatidylserine/phosphatidylglycerophosphate/cardiolipin synthase-like enzyme
MLTIFMASAATAWEIKESGGIEVVFFPSGDAIERIVAEIRAAKTEVLVQAYSFNSDQLSKTLVDEHNQGVKIVALLGLNRQNEKNAEAELIARAGIPVFIDPAPGIPCKLVIIIDRQVLLASNFNFKGMADGNNTQNLLVMKGGKQLIKRFIHEFEKRKAHSTVFNREAQ